MASRNLGLVLPSRFNVAADGVLVRVTAGLRLALLLVHVRRIRLLKIVVGVLRWPIANYSALFQDSGSFLFGGFDNMEVPRL